MAKLEGEAMLLGLWPNIETMELSITLPELELILEAARDKEHRHNKFMAAINGINLDEGAGNGKTAKEKFEEVERRIKAKETGKSVETIEFEELGFDVEIEE